MQKILVTGGCGFIGQHLVRHLLSLGFKVINVDVLTYAADESLNDSLKGHLNYRFYHADILDQNCIKKILFEEKPSAIIHLAAESHVDRSIEDPLLFVKTNVLGTCQLLELALSYQKTQSNFIFYHVSTDEVFGSLTQEDPAFEETTAYNPRSPYSASKASSDHFVRAFFETYKLPILMSNCSNNYGPHQFPEKMIPRTLISALSKRPIEVYGKGENIRDWLHVEDHVNGIVAVLENGKIGESYNIGGGTECSNINLVQKICSILDRLKPTSSSYHDLIVFVKDRPGHDFRYAINDSKIRNELSFAPERTLDEGLLETVQWYLDNPSWLERILARNKETITERKGLV